MEPVRPLTPIRETKQNLDGSVERFECYLLHRDSEYVVVAYLSDQSYAIEETVLAAGTLTIGHYGRSADHIVWEMYAPNAEFLGYYIHLCSDIELGDNEIRWRDLIADVWAPPGRATRILDEDELEKAVQSGQISLSEAARVRHRVNELVNAQSKVLQKLKRFNAGEILARLISQRERAR